MKPGVVFVGVASDGFAATARAVAFDMPFATAPVTPIVEPLFVLAAVAVDVVSPVPETLVPPPVATLGVTVGVTDAVTAPVVFTAPLLAAALKIAPASPSPPVVTTGVGVELMVEFAVCCGFV